ncbi:hypothetical protein V5T82_02210 [Magnetovibrio sp. PR-2]|uniref:hypothetical protein n=1 Tax=Magnetovibrio sp. PR-2 TaxID=3120356 RepID=UPI002FCE67B3
MYIKSDADEKDLIEQAIRDAEHARNEYVHTNVFAFFAGLKSWLITTLGARKSKNASASPNAQATL